MRGPHRERTSTLRPESLQPTVSLVSWTEIIQRQKAAHLGEPSSAYAGGCVHGHPGPCAVCGAALPPGGHSGSAPLLPLARPRPIICPAPAPISPLPAGPCGTSVSLPLVPVGEGISRTSSTITLSLPRSHTHTLFLSLPHILDRPIDQSQCC